MSKNRLSKIIVTFLVAVLFCGGALGCANSKTAEKAALTAVAVTKAPNKTSYTVGEPFNTAGMVVTASYADNRSKVVTDYTYSPSGALSAGTDKIALFYENKTAYQRITVEVKAVTVIQITTPPAKTAYTEGEAFDRAGMVITAKYNDGSAMAVTDYTVTPAGALSVGTEFVTIGYLGKTVTQNIAVAAKLVTAIAVTAPPAKTAYVVGQRFNTSGMVVKASFTDGTSASVIGYTVTPNAALKKSDTSVTVTYKGKSAGVAVTVVDRALSSIAIAALPNKTFYIAGEVFAPAGMVVKGTFNDGTVEVITDYTYNKTGALEAGDNSIEVSYNGKKTTLQITVSKPIASIAVTAQPAKTQYVEGQTVDVAGLEVTAFYQDSTSEKVTAFAYGPKGPLTVADKFITVTYGAQTAVTPITVAARAVTALRVSREPIKTKYIEGQTFDAEGMEVTTVYNDEATAVVPMASDAIPDGYTLSPLGALTKADTAVTVLYKGVVVTQPIVVKGGFAVEAEKARIYSSTAQEKTDSPLASGAAYAGELKVGNKILFEFTASAAGTASVVLRAASGNMLKGCVGDNWGPTEMGDTQLNKVADIFMNDNAVPVPDDTVMKGGESTVKNDKGEITGDFALWFNWSEMFFENIPVLAGKNTLVLQFKSSGIVNHWGDELTGNVDAVKVLFDGDVTGEAVKNPVYKATSVGGGENAEPVYASERSKTVFEFEDFEMKQNNNKEDLWIEQNADNASGAKFIDNIKSGAVFTFNVTLKEKEDNAVIDWVVACANWNNGNTAMENLGSFIALKINGLSVDLSKIKLLPPNNKAIEWTNWTSVIVEGVALSAGLNEIMLIRGSGCPNLDALNVYTGA